MISESPCGHPWETVLCTLPFPTSPLTTSLALDLEESQPLCMERLSRSDGRTECCFITLCNDQVLVSVDDEVRNGDVLVILEAMKMEHMIKAPIDGTVSAVSTGAGKSVHDGQVLMLINKKETSP